MFYPIDQECDINNGSIVEQFAGKSWGLLELPKLVYQHNV